MTESQHIHAYPTVGAMVVRPFKVEPHPNADKLEVVTFLMPFKGWTQREVTLVTGPHYKAHAEGIWFLPGSQLPGLVAEEMWLGKGSKWFEVRAFPIRDVLSEGIFAGAVWRKTPDAEFERWRFWKTHWTPGMDVSDYFGVTRPRSSAAEQAVSNREVAARENAPLGAIPAVGSTSVNEV